MNNQKTPVSVIIPTYHDWKRLSYCIDALSKQTYPQDKFEVIIVNNDPEDSPPELSLPDNFRIISEGKPGSYAARNAGIKEAKGEILAFTDSDCIPDKYWIENAVDLLRKGVDRLAGKVELFYSSKKLNVVELHEKLYAFDQKKYAVRGGAVTANMITWAKNFKVVGLFHEELYSGGDMEWGMRAKGKGLSISYAPYVVVKHPARKQIKEKLQKIRRVLAGASMRNPDIFRQNLSTILFRGFMPPVARIKELSTIKCLSRSDKIKLSVFTYTLKIYKSWFKICLILGLKSPERV